MACPCLVPGRKRHALTALSSIASWTLNGLVTNFADSTVPDTDTTTSTRPVSSDIACESGPGRNALRSLTRCIRGGVTSTSRRSKTRCRVGVIDTGTTVGGAMSVVTTGNVAEDSDPVRFPMERRSISRPAVCVGRVPSGTRMSSPSASAASPSARCSRLITRDTSRDALSRTNAPTSQAPVSARSARAWREGWWPSTVGSSSGLRCQSPIAPAVPSASATTDAMIDTRRTERRRAGRVDSLPSALGVIDASRNKNASRIPWKKGLKAGIFEAAYSNPPSQL